MQEFNYKEEKINERIVLMVPATGWWKRYISKDGDCVQPVAFFCTLEWEERQKYGERRWSDWQKQQQVVAVLGAGEEWNASYTWETANADRHGEWAQQLFYDPEYRVSMEDQYAGDEWKKSHQADWAKHGRSLSKVS